LRRALFSDYDHMVWFSLAISWK